MVCHLLSSPDFLDLYVSDLWGPRLLVVFAAAFWVVSHEQGGYPQGAGEFLLLLHSICSANNLVFPLCVFADIFLHWPIMHRASVSSICLPPYMSVVAILWGFYFSRNSHVMFWLLLDASFFTILVTFCSLFSLLEFPDHGVESQHLLRRLREEGQEDPTQDQW
jgi:hypothetical protein